MPPRISPPSSYDQTQLAELAKAPHRPDGEPLNVFATLAHRPELMRRVNALGGYFPRSSELGFRTRELAILRVAGTLGCEYELHHHRPQGIQAGLTETEVRAAADPSSGHGWAAPDRKILDLTDALIAHAPIDDATWAALDGVLDGGQRIELLVLVGFYAMLAGVLNTLGVEPDPPS
jgi:4-carboxymuconolactone decarboxylase